MEVVVGQIGKAHGLRGEVVVLATTDRPEVRFVAGARFTVAGGPVDGLRSLTVESARVHQGRWLVAFDEVLDRTAAEAVRGVELVLDASGEDPEDDAWYPQELVGLVVEDITGARLGEVVGLEHYPAQDLLVVAEPGGRRTRVPFVHALVPVVDVPGGRVVVDPPTGLFAGPEAHGDPSGQDRA